MLPSSVVLCRFVLQLFSKGRNSCSSRILCSTSTISDTQQESGQYLLNWIKWQCGMLSSQLEARKSHRLWKWRKWSGGNDKIERDQQFLKCAPQDTNTTWLKGLGSRNCGEYHVIYPYPHNPTEIYPYPLHPTVLDGAWVFQLQNSIVKFLECCGPIVKHGHY